MSGEKAKELKQKEEKKLWQAYKYKDCEESRRQLIIKYQPLVYSELGRLSYKPEHRLDLLQEGTVGLIEAVDRFEPERGVLFTTFARYRIRGRFLNYLKNRDENLPSSSHWEQELVGENDPQDGVDNLFWKEELKKVMNRLPSKEKTVLKETMLRDRSAEEVARSLDITPSYLYRLRKKGLRRLRGMLAPLRKELKKRG